mmetsp:Transcript_109828/g.311433  ORF Transcript_109828/g.311433 Transcript_109828/m.311433 type:complete len:89 (-) Transcript_109828:332-598(-)
MVVYMFFGSVQPRADKMAHPSLSKGQSVPKAGDQRQKKQIPPVQSMQAKMFWGSVPSQAGEVSHSALSKYQGVPKADWHRCRTPPRPK